jgi:hypothetical protein
MFSKVRSRKDANNGRIEGDEEVLKKKMPRSYSEVKQMVPSRGEVI